MRNPALPAELYIRNRQAFAELMAPNTIAILTSNDIQHTNADGVMGFVQNNDLLYLSGIGQGETILVLYPDCDQAEYREMLFVRRTDEQTLIWEGQMLTQEDITERSGVGSVHWQDQFESMLQMMAFKADGFYLGHNEHIKRTTRDQETRQDRMIAWCRKKYPLHDYYRAAKLTRQLRPVKAEAEVAMIRRAAEISAAGFAGVMRTLKPGVWEYELEAELTYAALRHGGRGNAFPCIVASGANACALHYDRNDSVCQDGELVLLDFGVCYSGYNSDTTRCLPVNGRFSPRQREVYEAVLHCLKEGSKMLKPGVNHREYETYMAGLVEEQLVRLGLLKQEDVDQQDPQKPLYKQYFMHGTAHYIGLDVHDVGLYTRPLEAGMVFTCEPGIYIREEGIGVRLEDDFLITEAGNLNLSAELPIEVEEIETLMAGEGSSVLNM